MASETMTREDIYREFAKGEDADGLYHVQMDEMADEIIRLRTTLAQRREGVSAAMVEAACREMFKWWRHSTTEDTDRDYYRGGMRDAIRAANAASDESALGARDGGAD